MKTPMRKLHLPARLYVCLTSFVLCACGGVDGPTVPSPPNIGTSVVTVTPGSGAASITFTPPSSTGGASISLYTANCVSASARASGSATGSPVVVNGLSLGADYACSVTATNGVGTGTPSATVNVAVPLSVPAAPLLDRVTGTATSQYGLASLAFTAPKLNGGAEILQFKAQCSNANNVVLATSKSSPLVVPGLTLGGTYSCAVSAMNSVGASVASGDVSVAVPLANVNRVHLIYAIPKDRVFNQDWSDSLGAAFVDLQVFYKTQIGGKSFTLHSLTPDVCYLPQDSSYYASDSWGKVLTDVQSCLPVSWAPTRDDWILYADVLHTGGAPGPLGGAGPGLGILGRQGLEGIGGASCVHDDFGVLGCWPRTRWTGGAGHELGHSFGLPHPLACDLGLPACDATLQGALMYLGYATYPDTWLLPDDIATLLASRFIQ